MRCLECGKEVDVDLKDEKMFYLPEGDSFTLLRSNVVGELVDGKIRLYNEEILPKVKYAEVK